MRLSTKLVTILILMNAFAGMFVASGLAADLHIEPQPGGDQQIDQVNQNASSVQPANGIGSTLFGLYTSVTNTLETVYNFVFFGPVMLKNLGLPEFLTAFFNSVTTLVVGRDIIYALTGRDI